MRDFFKKAVSSLVTISMALPLAGMPLVTHAAAQTIGDVTLSVAPLVVGGSSIFSATYDGFAGVAPSCALVFDGVETNYETAPTPGTGTYSREKNPGLGAGSHTVRVTCYVYNFLTHATVRGTGNDVTFHIVDPASLAITEVLVNPYPATRGTSVNFSASNYGFSGSQSCFFSFDNGVAFTEFFSSTGYMLSNYTPNFAAGTHTVRGACRETGNPSIYVEGPATDFILTEPVVGTPVVSDTSGPTVASAISPTTAMAGVAQTYSASISDPSGLDSCNISVDGVGYPAWLGNNALSGAPSVNATFATGPSTHAIQFNCYDSGGYLTVLNANVSVSAASSPSVPGTPPVVSDVTGPSIGEITPTTASVGVEQSFSATVTDTTGVDQCEVWKDGAFDGYWFGLGTHSDTMSALTAFSSAGTHSLRFRCYDSSTAGNVSERTVSVNVSAPAVADTMGPTIGAFSPGSFEANVLTNVTATVNDSGSGVDYCLLIDGDGGSVVMSVTGSTATAPYSFTRAGTNNLQIQCVDRTGNWNSGTITLVSVSAPSTPPQNNDTANPVVGAVSPSSVTVSQSNVFRASYSDVGTGVNSCILLVNGASQGDMTLSGGTASKSYTFNTAGSDIVQVRCRDGAGNYGYSAINNVTINTQTTAPVRTPTVTPTPTPTPTPVYTPSPSPTTNPTPTVQPVNPTLLQNLTNMGIAIHALVKLPDDGNANTQEDSAVYYIGADGKRHSFPNSQAYFTWYGDFSGVRVITAQQLASIPLGLNVRYRPGRRMVKFTTDPKVYVVARGGILRWVKTEQLAIALYGSNWNRRIDDIADTFYTNYYFGTDVASAADFNPTQQDSSIGYISTDLGY